METWTSSWRGKQWTHSLYIRWTLSHCALYELVVTVLCYRACFHSLVLGLGIILDPASQLHKNQGTSTQNELSVISMFLSHSWTPCVCGDGQFETFAGFFGIASPELWAQAPCVCQSQWDTCPSSAGSADMLSSHWTASAGHLLLSYQEEW